MERSIAQEHGGWRIEYRLRNEGTTTLSVPASAISARVEGWVSNSRVADHATPRRSVLELSGSSKWRAVADLIPSADEDRCCRESAVLQVLGDDAGVIVPRGMMEIAPGAEVRVRLLLEHQHVVYGAYDPLLGRRTVQLSLGSSILRDGLPLEADRHVPEAELSLGVPPADRRDSRQYVSAPDSLHLEADVPGNHQYRFPERPVRYATPMRLSFWYLIAPGTQGAFQARISQYRDSPISWKPLTSGEIRDSMATVGRWVHVERVFRTEDEATTLAVEFRLRGGDVGEVWIDDVTLEPVNNGTHGP